MERTDGGRQCRPLRSSVRPLRTQVILALRYFLIEPRFFFHAYIWKMYAIFYVFTSHSVYAHKPIRNPKEYFVQKRKSKLLGTKYSVDYFFVRNARIRPCRSIYRPETHRSHATPYFRRAAANVCVHVPKRHGCRAVPRSINVHTSPKHYTWTLRNTKDNY